MRTLCDRYGALLLIDETHTISAGWGGCPRSGIFSPDIFVIGKSIGGGIPSGAYGITQDLADRIMNSPDADLEDVGGVGGTLAGNVLSTAAMRATLGEVLTPDAFAHMTRAGNTIHSWCREGSCRQKDADDHCTIGCTDRISVLFTGAPQWNGVSASIRRRDRGIPTTFFMSNRGVLMTPFHNMALMCPARRLPTLTCTHTIC